MTDIKPTTTIAERMARYAVALKFEDLPAEVIHEVKRRVIDALGCAFGAWYAQPCVIARRVASTLSAQRGATLWGTTHAAPPDWAAFANGCLVRYLDYNDTYLSLEPAHPSDNIPATWAIAESLGIGGKDLITAIALAYEVQCRLCDAASIRARGWDHVTYGVFSTALAASRIMKLDFEHTRHTVNIAGVASAALRQARVGELSHWKGVAFANAARQGVFAAMIAKEGMTGPAPIFEGDKGFEKLVSGPLQLGGPFGETPEDDGMMITRTLVKRWPAEYHAQSAIEAALKVRGSVPSIPEIESITIESHDAAVDIIGSEVEKWHPTSRETADHSLPYLVAVALADGDVTPRQFEPHRLADPSLLELVQKVEVRRNRELSAMYPEAVANIVTVKLDGGRTITERANYPRGHARNPMTDAELETKFRSLADEVIGAARAKKVLQWLWKLEEKSNLGELMPMIQVHE